MQSSKPGEPHAMRCGAKKRDQTSCGAHPVRGTNRCRMHGGTAPQVKAKAGERLAEQQAQRAVGKLAAAFGEAEPVQNPLLELSKIAAEALRWKQAIGNHVAHLEQLRYNDLKGSEQMRAEIAIFERALDRCSTILANIVRLNIDERLATITDRQGHIIAGVIASVLEQLDLGDQADHARELIAVELERLDA